MKCASRGCTESIQLLLDRGADMSIQDENGNTAAHYAAFDNQREAYVMLLHNGYDESTVNQGIQNCIRLCTFCCFLKQTKRCSQ